jgi:hypothetical protein
MAGEALPIGNDGIGLRSFRPKVRRTPAIHNLP